MAHAQMNHRTIVHQFNPWDPVTAGIDTVIRDVVKFAPPQDDWCIVGVQRPEHGRDGLGRWRTVELEGRRVHFMPITALDPGDQRRVVPHSWRPASGLAQVLRVRDAGDRGARRCPTRSEG
jgi:hypothetical protein